MDVHFVDPSLATAAVMGDMKLDLETAPIQDSL